MSFLFSTLGMSQILVVWPVARIFSHPKSVRKHKHSVVTLVIKHSTYFHNVLIEVKFEYLTDFGHKANTCLFYLGMNFIEKANFILWLFYIFCSFRTQSIFFILLFFAIKTLNKREHFRLQHKKNSRLRKYAIPSLMYSTSTTTSHDFFTVW